MWPLFHLMRTALGRHVDRAGVSRLLVAGRVVAAELVAGMSYALVLLTWIFDALSWSLPEHFI
jgi:hypothetical protein